jgi:hypothetical protein
MTALAALFRALTGLFVDDGALASGLLGIVLVAALLAQAMPDEPSLSGAVLLLGCLGTLLFSVLSAARR